MLNKRERRWLKSREKRYETENFYCKWCKHRGICVDDGWDAKKGVCCMDEQDEDYKDVAVYEAIRVEVYERFIKEFGFFKNFSDVAKTCAEIVDKEMKERCNADR